MCIPPADTSPARSPLESLYREVTRDRPTQNPYPIALMPYQKPRFGYQPSSETAVTAEEPPSQTGRLDAFLGVGHYFSKVFEGSLLRVVAPQFQTIGAGLTRAAGGFVTAAGAAYRLYQAASNDIRHKDYSFSSTRKETVVSLGSIGAGIAVGETGFYLTAAALSLGAPVSLAATLAVGTALGTGLAVAYTRSRLGELYESIRRGA